MLNNEGPTIEWKEYSVSEMCAEKGKQLAVMENKPVRLSQAGRPNLENSYNLMLNEKSTLQNGLYGKIKLLLKTDMGICKRWEGTMASG